MIHLKLGMKLPGGTVMEVERLVPVIVINTAIDGTNVIRQAIDSMVQQFMDTLPRERDAR